MQKKTDIKKTPQELKKERLAKALRENLKKRKEKKDTTIKKFVVATLLMVLWLIPGFAADLNITSWGGSYQEAQKKNLFTPFEQHARKTIKEFVYDGGLDEIKAELAKETSDWDVVEVEASDLLAGCQQKYFDVLNWQKIGQRSDFLSMTTHNCGVGSVIWAMVMSYNPEHFKEKQPSGWKDFFDIEAFPGKRALRKTAAFTLEIALLAMGVKQNQLYTHLRDPKAVDAAFEKLDQLFPHILWWENGEQPIDWLTSGNAKLAAAYNGRIANMNRRGDDLVLVWQDALFSSDFWVVLRNSKNKDAAYQFLKFVSDKQLRVNLAEDIAYAPTLRAAYKLLNRAKIQNMPDIQTKGKMMIQVDNSFWAYGGPALEKRFDAWLRDKKDQSKGKS